MPTTDHHAARDAGTERDSCAGHQHLWYGIANTNGPSDLMCQRCGARTTESPDVLMARAARGAFTDCTPPAPRPEAGSGAPAPTVEAMAEALHDTDPHMSRSPTWAQMVGWTGLQAQVIASVLASYRARAAAVLARLAAPADPTCKPSLQVADPAPAALAGAVRDAAQAVANALDALTYPEVTSLALFEAAVALRAALKEERAHDAALADGAAGDEPHDATEAQYQEAAAICGLKLTTVRVAYRAVAGVIFDAVPPRSTDQGGRS